MRQAAPAGTVEHAVAMTAVVAAERWRFISRDGALVGLSLVYPSLLCASLVLVAGDVAPAFHIAFDRAVVIPAALSVAVLALGTCLFWTAGFSFGYLVSFNMLSVVA